MGIFLFWLMMGDVVALIASSKGRSAGLWFLYGVLIRPIALVHILVTHENQEATDTKAPLFTGVTMRVPTSPAELITVILLACAACSDGSTVPHAPTRVALTVRTQLFTDTGEPIRGVGFDIAVRPDGDSVWVSPHRVDTSARTSWSLYGTGTVATLNDSLGPAFHGTVRLSLRPGYGAEIRCEAFSPDTLTVRYDQPPSVTDDTLTVVHTLKVAPPLAVRQPGELCATSIGLGVQAWFIIDSIPPTTDSTFGRFNLVYQTTSANYDGHFKGAVHDSVLMLALTGDSGPTNCPTGGIAQLPVHPDGTIGVMAMSPYTPGLNCDYHFKDRIFLFVPNAFPWF